jgi:uncharacterized membrane protein YfcA
MPQELLFELDDVRITPHMAAFGGTSYQIANIGSVHVVQRRKRNPVAVAVFLLGLGILVASIVASRTAGSAEDYFVTAATGVVVMVAAFLLQLVWPRKVHVLILKTSGGDVEALASRKEQLVSSVKQAVEQAFVARARQPGSP